MTQSYNQITGTYDFGSIIRALQVQIVSQGGILKEYPYNFEGITKAIQDLTFAETSSPGSDIGPSPSFGDVTIDENGDPQFNYGTEPPDGSLWFDTRQGRLFVAYENEWYQTNGGDGFPIITTTDVAPAATNLVVGQMWYDRTNGVLYIFAGQYRETDGTIVTTPTATTVPVWSQLVDTSDVQTSMTLPIGNDTDLAAFLNLFNSTAFLPIVNVASILNQYQVNDLLAESVLLLDEELEKRTIAIGVEPPNSSDTSKNRPGDLWFDSEDIELSIWYKAPGTSYGQWVPTFNASTVDDKVGNLTTKLNTEINDRLLGDANLGTEIDTLDQKVITHRSLLQNNIDSLQAQVNAIPIVDLTPYVTNAQEQADITQIQNQVSGLSADVGNLYTKYAKIDYVNSNVSTLQADINTRATSTQLTAVQNSIPSLTGYATTAYVDSAVSSASAVTTAGGTITGKFTFDKADLAVPALDFSSQYYDGTLAQKYRTNCQMTTPHYATFGTNENMYEYAWDFDDNEDFCWTHGTNGKVASIDKTGIAATNYYIATFGTNTSSGRALTSTIDVGARLQTTKAALESLRTNAATATTLDELKAAIATALANV